MNFLFAASAYTIPPKTTAVAATSSSSTTTTTATGVRAYGGARTMPNIASLANDNNNTSNNTNNSQEEENKSEQNIQEITSSITARYDIFHS